MWCPEGYVSLAEIAAAVFVAADNRLWVNHFPAEGESKSSAKFVIDLGPPLDEIEAYSDWLMARLLEKYRTEIRVASPSGAALRISPNMMNAESYDAEEAEFYRTFPGERQARLTAGSLKPSWVDFKNMTVAVDLPEGWMTALRPIAGFPLCLPEATIAPDVEALVDHLIDYARNPFGTLQAFQESDQGKQIVQRMIEAWDRGEIKTKAEAKQRYGRNRKVEEWRALWRELAQSRPEVSTPGPRTKAAIR